MAERSWIRLSADITLLFEVPAGMEHGLLSTIIDVVQHDCINLPWKPEEFRETVLMLVIGRQLAQATERLDLFYGLFGLIIEQLNLTQEYQMCQNFAEDALSEL